MIKNKYYRCFGKAPISKAGALNFVRTRPGLWSWCEWAFGGNVGRAFSRAGSRIKALAHAGGKE